MNWIDSSWIQVVVPTSAHRNEPLFDTKIVAISTYQHQSGTVMVRDILRDIYVHNISSIDFSSYQYVKEHFRVRQHGRND